MILWTSVALVAVTLGVLYAMLAMGSEPLDSQLRAQVVDKKVGGAAAKNK